MSRHLPTCDIDSLEDLPSYLPSRVHRATVRRYAPARTSKPRRRS